MRSIVGVLVLLFVVNVCSQLTNLSAMTVQGIDMILVDSPGWLTHIQRSYVDREVFIFGESLLRPVSLGDDLGGFMVRPANGVYDITLQDLTTVYINQTEQYSFALANYDVDHSIAFSTSRGLVIPLTILGENGYQYLQRTVDPTTGINWSGVLMAAVRTDPTNTTNVLSYYAGWMIDLARGVPSFVILRTHFDATFGGGPSNTFEYDPILDVGILYNNSYTTFSPDYKPCMHILLNYGANNDTLVIVADPNSRTVYSGIFTPTGFNLLSAQYINMPNFVLVSCVLGFTTQQFYVGMAQSGLNVSGSIIRLDYTTANPVPARYDLPINTNNPKALAVDEFNNTLYIGLNGGSKVLRFDLTVNNVTGYQSLPEWLHRVWGASDMHRHVYFITYEEHAKVFRVAKSDFCPTECPYMGYCAGGKCTCSTGYTMSNGACVVTSSIDFNVETKLFNMAHGGEIALGVFFALAVIAAIAGWFLWWRGRRGAYQSV